jgi:hypothetical protein
MSDLSSYTLIKLRDICRQKGIRGFSIMKKEQLIEAILSQGIETIGFESSEALISKAQKENQAKGLCGLVKVDKLPGRFSKQARPFLPGYMSINVCSGATGWTKGLSPMILGPVTHEEVDEKGVLLPVATCVENYWQSLKLFQCDLDSAGNILPSYFQRKRDILSNHKGVRHPLPKAASKVAKNSNSPNKSLCLFSYVNGERLSYLEARKQIYCPLYAYMAEKSEAYAKLFSLHQEGYNLLILDYDGYPVDSTTLDFAFKDESRPFGHGAVLYCMLTGQRIWEK